jgi:formiminotetrahydrofolate cyclodeaminase
MDISISIKKYLEDLSSNSPTPGGGNVSAFCGALASALGEMVCNLTIGKKKYLYSEDELKGLRIKLETLREEFLTLAKEDNKAFEQVMEAFKMPKETDAEKSLRFRRIEETTIEAGIVPHRVISKCKEIVPMLLTIVEKGNQNSLSDAGVALALTTTASQGAYLNVLINCASYKNNQSASDILSKSKSELSELKAHCNKGLDLIERKLGG